MADKKGKGNAKGAGGVRTHNAQHTMRAASKQKVSQRQNTQSQSQSSAPAQQAGPSSGAKPPPAQTLAGASAAPRKQVFKQVLASPLTVNWPAVSNIDVQPVLYTLLDVLKHPAVTGSLRSAQGNGKGKARDDGGTSSQPRIPLIVGINSVSRHLESMIDHESTKRHRETSKSDGSSEDARPTPLNIVFVCRQDLDPPTLCAHFPMLTCAVNAVCHGQSQSQSSALSGVLLVPLPSGAERLISDALQLRRCSVLALSTDALAEVGLRETLLALLARIQEVPSLKPLRAAWLDSAADVALRTRQYLLDRANAVDADHTPAVTPKVKQVATTAPANLNAVKLHKKHTRQEKKEWRKTVRKQGHALSVAKDKRVKNKERKVRSQERIKAGNEKATKKAHSRHTKGKCSPVADVEMKDAEQAAGK